MAEAWWHTHPSCNIGLATGVIFDVVDIDGEPGEEAFGQILPGYIHPGPEAHTGRGRHLYFATSGLRNAARAELKIDFRGHNGYVVAPPSVHPDGHRYVWITTPDAPLPDLQPELREALGLYKFHKPDPRDWVRDLNLSDGLDLRHLVEQLYGPQKWRRMGELYKTICPLGLHSDSDPSFTIYPDNHYHCFGCGAHGWAYQLDRRLKEGSA